MLRVEKDFEEFFRFINEYSVRYVVIGSFAVAFHALPRYTKDIDVLVEPTEENAGKLMKALEAFGFDGIGLAEDDFRKKGRVIQLGHEPVRIDILTSVEGCGFTNAWKKRKRVVYGTENVNIVGFDELVRMKQRSKRKQDIADLEILQKVKRKR